MSNRGVKSERTLQIIHDLENGMLPFEVAKKHGVSQQHVNALRCSRNIKRFKTVTAEVCVYPNLRKWFNKNKVTKKEFLEMTGLSYHNNNLERLKAFLSGEGEPRKSYIDAMLKATGMTYEEMFYMDGDT